MFEKNRNNQQPDALDERIHGLRNGLRASAKLKAAAIDGEPLRTTGIRYTVGMHVRKFSKAVLLYAACVALLLGGVFLLPKLFGTGGPVAPQPSQTTTDAPTPECEHKYIDQLPLGGHPCTDDWSYTSVCKYCKHRVYHDIPAPGHNFVDGVCTRCFARKPDSTPEEQEIISAYAQQFGKNESKLSVRIVAEYGDVYAVYVDEAGFAYEDEMIEEVVHFYPFRYTNTQTMSIYKDGRIYTLPEAYEAGVFNAKNVLDLYLLHAEKEGYLDEKDPEKFYCPATLENEFTEDGIIIIVFPEYNFESYTVDDFSEIGCIEVKELSYDVEAGVLNRFILLTLDQKSKQNVLDCIQVLQQRVDIYSAEPNLIGHFD